MKAALGAAVLLMIGIASCSRETRDFHPGPAMRSVAEEADRSGIHPGATLPTGQQGVHEGVKDPYEGNAYAVSQGEQLYNAYNCVGCHEHGGGGIGPALMDFQWLYGSSPQDIYTTIVDGRPGGMPAFRGKIPNYQVWQLVAYVRSMSGQLRKDVAPGRSDHMTVKKSEEQKEKETPSDRGGKEK